MFSKLAILSLFAVAATAQTPPNANPVLIKPTLNSKYCLQAQSNSNGGYIIFNTCNSSNANQQWTFQNGQIRAFGSKCLDVTNGVTKNGAQLQTWDCFNENTNQQWYYTGDNRIAWTNHGSCLDVTDGNLYPPTNQTQAKPQLWKCTDYNSNQEWTTQHV